MNLLQTKLENAFSDHIRTACPTRNDESVISYILWTKSFRVRYFMNSYWRASVEGFSKKITIEPETKFLNKIGYIDKKEIALIEQVYIRHEFNSSREISIWSADLDPVILFPGSSHLVVDRMTRVLNRLLFENNMAVDSRLDQYANELAKVWDRINSMVK